MSVYDTVLSFYLYFFFKYVLNSGLLSHTAGNEGTRIQCLLKQKEVILNELQ